MDFLNLIQNAVIMDQDGDFCGHVRGFEIDGHRMKINVHLYEGSEPDDDGGSRMDVDFTPEQADDAVSARPTLKVVGGRDG